MSLLLKKKQKKRGKKSFLSVVVLCIGGSEDSWTCCSQFLVTGKAADLGGPWSEWLCSCLSIPGLTVEIPPSEMVITDGASGVCLGHEVTDLLDVITVTETFTMSTLGGHSWKAPPCSWSRWGWTSQCPVLDLPASRTVRNPLLPELWEIHFYCSYVSQDVCVFCYSACDSPRGRAKWISVLGVRMPSWTSLWPPYLGPSCYVERMNLVLVQPFWVRVLLESCLLHFLALKMTISTQQR